MTERCSGVWYRLQAGAWQASVQAHGKLHRTWLLLVSISDLVLVMLHVMSCM